MSRTEEPPYTVERADGPIELRAYPSLIVASVRIEGSRSSAIQAGFRTLADYIFGANDGGKKIEMTAPVMEHRNDTGTGDASGWTIRFVMPREWSLTSLPKPRDANVKLEDLPSTTFAVMRFSGFWRDGLLQTKTDELRKFMAAKGWVADGPPIYAFYNPPWTLPFLRRNEIMIAVAHEHR